MGKHLVCPILQKLLCFQACWALKSICQDREDGTEIIAGVSCLHHGQNKPQCDYGVKLVTWLHSRHKGCCRPPHTVTNICLHNNIYSSNILYLINSQSFLGYMFLAELSAFWLMENTYWTWQCRKWAFWKDIAEHYHRYIMQSKMSVFCLLERLLK